MKKLKKIGVLNFHYSKSNYGAVLQAASLQRVLESLGCDAEHIDFIPTPGYKKSVPFKHKFKETILSILEGINILPFVKMVMGKKNYDKTISKIDGAYVFDDFRRNWLKVGSKNYSKPEDISINANEYYAVVVGSDQVWRPLIHVNPYSDYEAYFLTFVPKGIKKISYAASFGVDKWEQIDNVSFTHKIKSELRTFDHISVREASAVKLCKDVFNVETKHVLDPTLLVGVEFFDNIISTDTTIAYDKVVYYKLDVDSEFLDNISKIGKDIASDVENIYYKYKDGVHSYNSVPEWLNKIKNSKLVITDSFHCVCLSILFERNFICIANPGRGLSRLESLLQSLEIENRIVIESELHDSYLDISPIDYDKVRDKLEKLRMESKKYLENSIK